jgi:hypothetical protein
LLICDITTPFLASGRWLLATGSWWLEAVHYFYIKAYFYEPGIVIKNSIMK